MSASKPALTKAQLEHYDRLMLRSALVSLFWTVIADRKKRHGYRLQDLADALGMDKSGVSRWFSGNDPNWTLNTIADIANALNVELRVEAVDRGTGEVCSSHGRQTGQREAGKVSAEAQPLRPNVKARGSNGKKSLAPSQPARARDEDHRRTRQHKGSRPP